MSIRDAAMCILEHYCNRADERDKLKAQVEELQAALKESNVLIDDQGRLLNPELYGKNYVEETRERCKSRGGSLAYGADVLQKNRALLAKIALRD